jgi:hypothetical protein
VAFCNGGTARMCVLQGAVGASPPISRRFSRSRGGTSLARKELTMKNEFTLAEKDGTRPRRDKPTHDQIAALAHRIYLEHGCQPGHDVDDWLRAEELLTQEIARAASAAPRESSPPQGVHSAPGARPLNSLEDPFARAERASGSPKELPRQTAPARSDNPQFQSARLRVGRSR